MIVKDRDKWVKCVHHTTFGPNFTIRGAIEEESGSLVNERAVVALSEARSANLPRCGRLIAGVCPDGQR